MYCEQTIYRGIERGSKERSPGIDPFRWLRHKTGDVRRPAQVANARRKGDPMKSLSIFAISAALALSVLGGRGAFAQQEIDPDHFDSPPTEPAPQPRTADRKGTVTRYDRAFSLPYSALCNGKKLAAGKYSISLRSDGNVGQAALYQKGHAVEIVSVVQTRAPQHHHEVVVVENDKNGRTISIVRVSGFDFVFDPKHSADSSPNSRLVRTEKLPLTPIATNEIASRAASRTSTKP